jgi:hypothetical protein
MFRNTGPRYRCEETIKMDFREIGLEGVDWIYLAQNRDRWRDILNMIPNLRILQKTGNFSTS